MLIGGIDPGKRGAIVIVDTESTKGWFTKLEYDDEGILTTPLKTLCKDVQSFTIECIHGRGGWGAKQNFMMGFYYGQLLNAVKATKKPYQMIIPRDWTAIMHADIEVPKKTTAKEKSVLAYLKYFPHDPIGYSRGKKTYHDGVIDAFLIVAATVIRQNRKLRKWHFD